jgi:ribosomal protein S18 acetylase RimI-like enzyme
MLMLEALSRLREIGSETASLWVLADKIRAIRFYERAGFGVAPGSRRSIKIGGVALAGC